MTPLERYHHDVKTNGFQSDPAQERAVICLDDLHHRLVKRIHSQSKKSLKNWLSRTKTPDPEKGLYFWGGVGRGKTYLMDLFFEGLPFKEKIRIHFHRFMQKVHEELKLVEGQKNPLELVAEKIAKNTIVICFDEFFVSDIADAMILGGLFEQLFARGVTLVATSNIVPDNLYENGLQRQRFLPVIDMLNRYTDVINVDSGIDYRLRVLEQAQLYHYPLNGAAEVSLKQSFRRLAPETAVEGTSITILGRQIAMRFCADDVGWFTFEALCDGPRSPADYIELAKVFHAVIISDVPEMNNENNDQTRRFINMIDEFYDRYVKVVISAEKPINELYSGDRLAFEFERTQSRLLEMQSHEYLAKEHRC